jgi:cell division protein FtsI/penicillin-binding protein 2
VHEKSYNSRSILILFLFLLLPLCLFIFRLFYLQIIKSDFLKELADSQHNVYYKITPDRGVIYDRRMKALAMSFDAPSCYANPRKIVEKEEVAAKLAAVLNLEESEIIDRLMRDKAFIWIKRHITLEEAQIIEKFNIEGVKIIKESKRFYPNQSLASHLLGYVGIDNEGLAGVELYYDNYLKGAPGLNIVRRDAKGRMLYGQEHQITGALDSYDLVLTIDRFIQHVAERELDKVYLKYNAESASIIIVETTSGEILALANRPTFNPNNFNEYEPATRRNRAVTDTFEPGSVFKIVAATAALEEGVVTLEDKIYCEDGKYRVHNHVLHDHKPFKELTFEGVIEHSSNIGIVKVAQMLDEDKFYQQIKSFGFGRRTGIDLPGEQAGVARPPSAWSKTSIAAIPMGYEVAVTSPQVLLAMSSLANDGVLVKPHIVKRVIDRNNQTIKEFKTENIRRVCSVQTAGKVKKALTSVVESGTGKRAKVDGYEAAGKTGTAKKVSPSGGYSRNRYLATFCGFLPAMGGLSAGSPKIAIIVVVNEPKPVYYGGSVAAPVFKSVAEEVIRYIENNGLD